MKRKISRSEIVNRAKESWSAECSSRMKMILEGRKGDRPCSECGKFGSCRDANRGLKSFMNNFGCWHPKSCSMIERETEIPARRI